MIPKILHQTARTKTLSWEENRLRQRAMRLLPGWEFILHDDDDNARLIAQSFPQIAAAFNAIKRGVVKADIARCAYLSIMGGFYIDTDYKLLRTIDDTVLNHRCVLPVSRTGDVDSPAFRLGNAVMASEPGYPFWSDFIADIFSKNDMTKIAEGSVEGLTGPEAVTAFYVKNRSRYPEINLPSRNLFHPELRMGGIGSDRDRDTYGVHQCWGSWRSKSLTTNAKNFILRKVTAL